MSGDFSGDVREDDTEIKEITLVRNSKVLDRQLSGQRDGGRIQDSRNLAMVSGSWSQQETGLPRSQQDNWIVYFPQTEGMGFAEWQLPRQDGLQNPMVVSDSKAKRY